MTTSSGLRLRAWRAATTAGAMAGRLTSPLRPLPDFLVIGAQRAGTTSLHRYLLEHPAVLGARATKGVHWYDAHFDRPPGWYRSFFPSVARRRWVQHRVGVAAVVGESSPYYLFHPFAPERIAATLPDAKLIAVLRDPVSRAWSHYLHNVARGMEDLSFADALDAEPERLAGADEALRVPGAIHLGHRRGSYVARGRYLEQLDRLHTHVPPERVLVLFSHDLDRDPTAVVARAHRFLGLPPHPVAASERWNRQPTEPMPPATRQRLIDVFAAPDAALAARLGVELPWSAAGRR